MKTIIDTTKAPSIPYDNWTIESHDTSLGKIDLSKIDLHLDDEQKDGKYIEGNKLREKLKDKPVLNATVLDYLMKHQGLIPENWKGKTQKGYTKFIYFWGTIYRNSDGYLCVRYVYFDGGAWSQNCSWLGFDWSGGDPAAVASSLSLKPLKSSDSGNLEDRVEELENDMAKLKKLINL